MHTEPKPLIMTCMCKMICKWQSVTHKIQRTVMGTYQVRTARVAAWEQAFYTMQMQRGEPSRHSHNNCSHLWWHEHSVTIQWTPCGYVKLDYKQLTLLPWRRRQVLLYISKFLPYFMASHPIQHYCSSYQFDILRFHISWDNDCNLNDKKYVPDLMKTSYMVFHKIIKVI
jgi:hypothetical protein